jgi:hypothetical protein
MSHKFSRSASSDIKIHTVVELRGFQLGSALILFSKNEL